LEDLFTLKYSIGLMKNNPGFFICLLIMITGVIISGCVAPPAEVSSGAAKTTSPATVVSSAQTFNTSYIAEVTPFVTFYPAGGPTTETPGYHVFTTPTPNPGDKSCRIYTTTQKFTYNGTAFTFDLKNPPMYINYSVVPANVSEKKVATMGYSNKTEYYLQYTAYDPQSYLEITVRNKTSGEIYLQDGFGKEYSTYLQRTLKVLKQDDMLVEIKGNKITATINAWVKPAGNFDDADNRTFEACTYWGQSTRDNTALAYVTATPTPTWTWKAS